MTRPTRIATAVLTAWLIAGLVGLAGCGCEKKAGKTGGPGQLRQNRMRFTADAGQEKCFIVAEIGNPGELAVKEAWVTAKLTNPNGKQRGINHYPLRDMKPGETRTISLTVTAHGSFTNVDLTFHEPPSE